MIDCKCLNKIIVNAVLVLKSSIHIAIYNHRILTYYIFLVKLSLSHDPDFNYYIRFAIYIGFAVVFMIIAASVG